MDVQPAPTGIGRLRTHSFASNGGLCEGVEADTDLTGVNGDGRPTNLQPETCVASGVTQFSARVITVAATAVI
jgi:hypothetical protein